MNQYTNRACLIFCGISLLALQFQTTLYASGFSITAVPTENAGRLIALEDKGGIELASADGLYKNHQLTVSPDYSIMAINSGFEDGDDVVLIALGTAALGETSVILGGEDDDTENDLTVENGVVALTGPMQDAGRVRVRFANSKLVLPYGGGWWLYARNASNNEIAIVYLRGPDTDVLAAGSYEIGGTQYQLAPQEMLLGTGDNFRKVPAEPWLTTNNVSLGAAFGDLGIQSANFVGKKTESELATSVLVWDSRAEPSNIQAKIDPDRFDPENRLVFLAGVEATNARVQTGTTQSGAQIGANEIPVLSPASISVGGGVTALQINAGARGLAGSTNSQGLGFGGITSLAVPAFSGTIRTVTPGGIAAP